MVRNTNTLNGIKLTLNKHARYCLITKYKMNIIPLLKLLKGMGFINTLTLVNNLKLLITLNYINNIKFFNDIKLLFKISIKYWLTIKTLKYISKNHTSLYLILKTQGGYLTLNDAIQSNVAGYVYAVLYL